MAHTKGGCFACKTRDIGEEDYSECLSFKHNFCFHAVQVGDIVYCFHKKHKEFQIAEKVVKEQSPQPQFQGK